MPHHLGPRPINHRIEVKQITLIKRTVQVRRDRSVPGGTLPQRASCLAELPLTRVTRWIIANGLVAKKLVADLLIGLPGSQERFKAFSQTSLVESNHQMIPRCLYAIGTNRINLLI